MARENDGRPPAIWQGPATGWVGLARPGQFSFAHGDDAFVEAVIDLGIAVAITAHGVGVAFGMAVLSCPAWNSTASWRASSGRSLRMTVGPLGIRLELPDNVSDRPCPADRYRPCDAGCHG